MNILIIGSGAREHAIANAFRRSEHVPILYCIGSTLNPGIRQLTDDYWVGSISDSDSAIKKAQEWNIDFAIIGPEAPLGDGLADALWEYHIPVVGPKKTLARIETSKAFTRDLLKKYHINGSPDYYVCHTMKEAKQALDNLGDRKYVIKADGLMSGKGVFVAGDHLHSLDEAYACVEKLFSSGHSSIVIEEKLIGEEFSLLCFCDGKTLIPMPIVQDHKRAFVNDEGPNTGGYFIQQFYCNGKRCAIN
jgi:phosphoribosylamine--glycine ligase